MRHTTRRRVSRQVESLRQQLAQVDGWPFADILSTDLLEQVLADEHVAFRDRIYPPLLTLAMMLSQSRDADASLRQALARLQARRAVQGLPALDADTGAYCQARRRLPEGVLAPLTRRTGQRRLLDALGRWCWRGRDVKRADGTTLCMPDTRAHQKAYPQAKTHKPGLGLPILRCVMLFSLAVGTVLNAAFDRYQGNQTGETALLRRLYDDLDEGDVLLADTCLCTYFLIALLLRRGVDVVVPLHQCRRADFRQGQRLGHAGHPVVWSKPARPAWLTAQEYAQFPDTRTVRALRVRVREKTSRRRTFVVVTTLLDAEAFPKAALAELFRQRWHAERELRALKDVLQPDVLRGQTPAMVHKEWWAHLLAYNLIGTVMARAAQQHGQDPRKLSFKGALQTMRGFALPLWLCAPRQLPDLVRRVLAAIVQHRLGHRPGRLEPRARKRRPKPYKLLTQPRAKARKLEVSKRSG